MKTVAWLSFWLVAAIWGSSFLLIRVGVEQFTPGQVAFIRCLIAAIGLNVVMLMRGKRWPTDRRTWIAFILVGIGNAALPYWLIGLSEQIITSSLASIIQATVPLFSLVFAHFMLSDERINPQKIVGLMLGFIGILILSVRQGNLSGEFTGILLMVAGSASYGLFAVYNRKALSNRIEPIVIAASTFIVATLGAAAIMLIEPALGVTVAEEGPITRDVWFAVIMLGLVNTFVAYLFFYYIIRELGAFRATGVTYIVPVFGVTLGALILREPIDITVILGAALIMSGIAVINLGGRVWSFVRVRIAAPAPTP